MTTDVAYAICSFNDIPSRRAMGFQLMIVAEDGSQRPWPIFVIRWGKQVFGYLNMCPHDKVNLDWERNQFLDGNGLRILCGKHGSLFEIGTGLCVDGPCKGESLTPVALTVLDGDICVTGVTLVEDDEDEEAETGLQCEEGCDPAGPPWEATKSVVQALAQFRASWFETRRERRSSL